MRGLACLTFIVVVAVFCFGAATYAMMGRVYQDAPCKRWDTRETTDMPFRDLPQTDALNILRSHIVVTRRESFCAIYGP